MSSVLDPKISNNEHLCKMEKLKIVRTHNHCFSSSLIFGQTRTCSALDCFFQMAPFAQILTLKPIWWNIFWHWQHLMMGLVMVLGSLAKTRFSFIDCYDSSFFCIVLNRAVKKEQQGSPGSYVFDDHGKYCSLLKYFSSMSPFEACQS